MGLFEETSGGFTQDYISKVTDVVFTSGEYGSLEAAITNTYDEPILTNDGTLLTFRVERFITIGTTDKGWQPTDNGKAFHNVDDPTKKVNSQSKWARLILRIVSLDPSFEAKYEANYYSGEALIGMHLRWQTVEGDYYKVTERNLETARKAHPECYVGDQVRAKEYVTVTEVIGSGAATTNGSVAAPFNLADVLNDTEADLLREALKDKDVSTEGKFQAAVMSQLAGLSGESAKAVVNALGPKTSTDFRMALVGI